MKYTSNIKGQTWAERYNIDRLSKSVHENIESIFYACIIKN